MTTTALVTRWCITCRADAEFEQPECLDAHDGDCPEWVCVQCGEAFFVGFAASDRGSAGRSRADVA